MALPVVAIVGRPNVGKSTLFNRLVGQKKSFVHDRPGVTRDRLYEEAEHEGRRFLAVDTGGFDPGHAKGSLLEAMRKQVMIAIEEADVIVFVVDARAGLVASDADVAVLLRKTEKPVLLAVNKVDGARHEDLTADFWKLGPDRMFPVSAAHGHGVYELVEAILARLPEAAGDLETAEDGDEDEVVSDFPEDHPGGVEIPAGPLRIAVVGRPNIGKSTLINQLLGEERHVVHDEPGTTTDPVDSTLVVGARTYTLVDTAGVRRKSKIEDELERFVSLRSIQAIERAHVALLVVDATVGITDQDAKLAQLVVERGRGLVVLFNKWDLTKAREDVDAKGMEEQLRDRLPHAVWAPRLFISAKTGKGVHRVLPAVDAVYEQMNRHLGTAEVNRFLERVLAAHTPPQKHHHPVRLYYATQTRVRPPTFVFMSNTPDGVLPAYRAFLANRLREEYGFEGVPLRLLFKKRRGLGP